MQVGEGAFQFETRKIDAEGIKPGDSGQIKTDKELLQIICKKNVDGKWVEVPWEKLSDTERKTARAVISSRSSGQFTPAPPSVSMHTVTPQTKLEGATKQPPKLETTRANNPSTIGNTQLAFAAHQGFLNNIQAAMNAISESNKTIEKLLQPPLKKENLEMATKLLSSQKTTLTQLTSGKNNEFFAWLNTRHTQLQDRVNQAQQQFEPARAAAPAVQGPPPQAIPVAPAAPPLSQAMAEQLHKQEPAADNAKRLFGEINNTLNQKKLSGGELLEVMHKHREFQRNINEFSKEAGEDNYSTRFAEATSKFNNRIYQAFKDTPLTAGQLFEANTLMNAQREEDLKQLSPTKQASSEGQEQIKFNNKIQKLIIGKAGDLEYAPNKFFGSSEKEIMKHFLENTASNSNEYYTTVGSQLSQILARAILVKGKNDVAQAKQALNRLIEEGQNPERQATMLNKNLMKMIERMDPDKHKELAANQQKVFEQQNEKIEENIEHNNLVEAQFSIQKQGEMLKNYIGVGGSTKDLPRHVLLQIERYNINCNKLAEAQENALMTLFMADDKAFNLEEALNNIGLSKYDSTGPYALQQAFRKLISDPNHPFKGWAKQIVNNFLNPTTTPLERQNSEMLELMKQGDPNLESHMKSFLKEGYAKPKPPTTSPLTPTPPPPPQPPPGIRVFPEATEIIPTKPEKEQ